MRNNTGLLLASLGLSCATLLAAQHHRPDSNSNIHPPVSETDVQIVHRARQILSSPEKWNRSDNRKCPHSATTVSIYCALEQATRELGGDFEHRGAAMQEARFVIDDIAPPRDHHYPHRLMGFNNDPATTFADVQRMMAMLEERVATQVAQQSHK